MTGLYTYVYHKNQPNAGRYTDIPYMDPMGYIIYQILAVK